MIPLRYIPSQLMRRVLFEENFILWGLAIPQGQRLADIGSNNGVLSRRAARWWKASHLHMVDPCVAPTKRSRVFCPETYWSLRADRQILLNKLGGQIDSVISIHAIHEFEDIPLGIANILELFPIDGNGIMWICDYAQDYWAKISRARLLKEDREHYERDYANLSRFGLTRNDNIKDLWFETWHTLGLSGQPPIGFEVDRFFLVCPGYGPAWEKPIPQWRYWLRDLALSIDEVGKYAIKGLDWYKSRLRTQP